MALSNENLTIFQRQPHDREHPYSMISNALIRDENLSLKAVGLLTYLLSHRDDFKITFESLYQYVKKRGTGRDALYAIIRECCEVGYMKQEKFFRSEGKYKIQCECVYFVSEFPEFKKSFRNPGNQDDEKPDIIRKTNPPIGIPLGEKINKKKDLGSQAHPDVAPLLLFFLSLRKENYPKSIDLTPYHLKKAKEKFSLLLEKRTIDELKQLMKFSMQHEFWSKNGESYQTFCKCIEKIDKAMQDPKQSKEIEDQKLKKRFQENSILAKKIVNIVKIYLDPDESLIARDNCIECKNSRGFIPIGYNENGFTDQLSNAIRTLSFAPRIEQQVVSLINTLTNPENSTASL